MPSEDPDEPEESAHAAFGRAAREDPRVRHFPFLGWSVFCFPVDLFEFRIVARMVMITMHGFVSEELYDLRARRLTMDEEPERTWWLIAIPAAAIKRRWAGAGPSPHG